MRSSRCQGAAGALRRSSSASDSFGPIRRMTNRPRLSKKMELSGLNFFGICKKPHQFSSLHFAIDCICLKLAPHLADTYRFFKFILIQFHYSV